MLKNIDKSASDFNCNATTFIVFVVIAENIQQILYITLFGKQQLVLS